MLKVMLSKELAISGCLSFVATKVATDAWSPEIAGQMLVTCYGCDSIVKPHFRPWCDLSIVLPLTTFILFFV
jgi:hypothetical protein